MTITKKQIDKAIAKFNVEIIKGYGYQYFISTRTSGEEVSGDQVGKSVMVCYLKHQTLFQWERDAQEARRSHDENMKENRALMAPDGFVMRFRRKDQ